MNAIPCPRPTTNLQGSSGTPPRRLQDASRTPSRHHKTSPCRLRDALKSFSNRHEASSRLQRAPRLLKTSPKRQNHLQAASEKPPRRPKTSPRRCPNGVSHENMQFSSPSEPTTTSVAYAQAVLLCKLLLISTNS